MEKITVAQVGFGGAGKRRVKALLKDERAILVGVADASPAALAAVPSLCGSEVKTYTSYEQLIEELQPQAVIVSAPNYLHQAVATFALSHQADVLCEKPFGLDAEAVIACIKAAQHNQKFLKIATNYLHFPTVQLAKSVIRAGEIGAIKKIHFIVGHNRAKSLPEWFLTPPLSGGGALKDVGSHALILLLDLLAIDDDEITQVNCQLDFQPAEAAVEISAACELSSAAGKDITFVSTWNAQEAFQYTLKVEGEAGWLSIENPDLILIQRKGSNSVENHSYTTDSDYSWLLDTQTFVDSIQHRDASAALSNLALKCAQVTEALYLSWRKRNPVEFAVTEE
ncbi:Gfo/Idh/MocA family oxidoreductase [Phormidium tenue FACHB-886]|nr:Gfo/Idh/MocA family oxidoreductase [Phormidium tenue FACHB-886]